MTQLRDSTFLRAELARVAGIFLGEPAVDDRDLKPANTPDAPPDRDEVRRILVEAGAPAGDLEWLIASCPSVDDAEGYRAPPRIAWCVDCGQATACDDDGCIACRGDR